MYFDQDLWITVWWMFSIIETDRVLKSGTTLLLAQTARESWLLHLLPVPWYLASLYTVAILIVILLAYCGLNTHFSYLMTLANFKVFSSIILFYSFKLF